MEDQPRRGYPIWAWIVGASAFFLLGILSCGDSRTGDPSNNVARSNVNANPVQPGPHQVERTDIRCNNMDTIREMTKASEDGEYERHYDLLYGPNCKRIFKWEIVHGPFAIADRGDGATEWTYQLHELSDGTRYWFASNWVTPVSADQPAHIFSPDSLELLALYRELEEFRYDSDFHSYCYAGTGEYGKWAEGILALNENGDTVAIISDTGIAALELWSLGLDYCNNQGNATEESKSTTDRMNPTWLAQPAQASTLADKSGTGGVQEPVSEAGTGDLESVCEGLRAIIRQANAVGMSGEDVQAMFAAEGMTPRELADLSAACNR